MKEISVKAVSINGMNHTFFMGEGASSQKKEAEISIIYLPATGRVIFVAEDSRIVLVKKDTLTKLLCERVRHCDACYGLRLTQDNKFEIFHPLGNQLLFECPEDEFLAAIKTLSLKEEDSERATP